MTDDIIDSGSAADDGDEGSPSDDDSAALVAAEKRVKDAQSAMHSANEEKALLRGQLDVLLASKGEEKPKPDPLEDPDVLEKLRDDPIEVARYADRRSEERVAVLRREMAQYAAHTGLETDNRFLALDPAREALQERVKELQKDEAFKGFSEPQLFIIAKKEADDDPNKIERVPGAPAGPGAIPAKKPDEPVDEIEGDPILRAALEQMIGHDAYAKEEVKK